jgi:hypothetical protein
VTARRGRGSRWDEVAIPGLDYVVIESTYGKSGPHLECQIRSPRTARIWLESGWSSHSGGMHHVLGTCAVYVLES